MPLFFNRSALTERQATNWLYAEEMYLAVQRANGLKAPRLPRLREKSALFARLLDGKVPLVNPPPTYMSYPWYVLIEDAGPFPVEIALNSSDSFITIGGCAWTLLEANASSQALLTLRCKSTTEQPSLPLWTAGRELMLTKPQFTVQFKGYPPCTLSLGSRTIVVQREYARKLMTWANATPPEPPTPCMTLISGMSYYLGLTLGDVRHIAPHPEEALARAEEQATSKLDRFFVEMRREALAADVEQYLQDPTSQDMVELQFLDWVLTKTSPDWAQHPREFVI